ncbi:non-ribosomal peptide synthetase [Pseudomonas sp. SDI]|uniref:non-ribosomal peptide synthetase n=1 Tax=Pseudomonas sp. SDI TaxID=2170734 RepID=UPI002114600C|nr:non-ribosomal peptide synthetase [Pseudomonas sp. SDI]
MLKHSPARTEELVARIGGLDSGKRRQLFAKLHQAGVAVARLPIVPASEGGALPLSSAQQRQLFLWQLDPQGCAYNLPAALRLRGTLDVAALHASFQALLERQGSLRTRYVQVDEQARQVLAEASELVIEAQPLALSGQGVEGAIQACIEAELTEPFDLLQGLPLRVRLLRIADDDHLLLLTLHHIATDGWAMGVLVEELLELYSAAVLGRAAQLPALPVSYADYAQWQHEWMDAGERERQLGYWRERLGSEHPVLELPGDRPRPTRQRYRGAHIEVPLSAELSARLRALALREQVTPFMLLLASFEVLLHRYSGQADLRIGVPNANRNRLETERLIGLFVNTQIFRAQLHGAQPFSALLQEVAEAAQEAQAHQDLPFEQLVEALQPARSLSHNPLFQVMFNHQPQAQRLSAVALPGLYVEGLELASSTAQLDLTLETYDAAEGFTARFVYATDLFEASTIERMARHWLNLLEGIVAAPDTRVADLPMLDADERWAMVEGWNATATEYPLQSSVQALIEAQVERVPDAPALLFGEVELSYAELNARANQLAHRLIEAGVGPDVLVGIAAERSLDMVVGLLGVLKAGGAYVPLDPEYPEERLAYMFEDSAIRLLLTQKHLCEALPIPASLATLLLDEPLDGYATHNPNVEVTGENLAYVIYTSGSTGKPKGAGNRHSALTNRLCWMQQAYGLDDSDTVLQKTPFSFDVSVWEFFWPLMTGARLALAAPGDHRDPAKLVELIERHQVTTLHFVPSMLQVFLQSLPESMEAGSSVGAGLSRDRARSARQESHSADLLALRSRSRDTGGGGVRRIICSGEALPVDAQLQVFAKLPEASLYNLYGPTEAAIDVTHWTCVDEGRDGVPIGHPIANLSTFILDPELNPVPVGVIGELYLGGEGLARGYQRRPGLTAERFMTSPFGNGERLYRTGDLARYRADGVIEYAGRIDHQVKIRGLRIELGEIEARLNEQDPVREAVVLALPGASGQQLVGYVVPTDTSADESTLREQIKSRLKEHLPDYMIPAQWVFLAEFPLSPNGKLERKALPKPDASQQQAAYIAPHSELEQRIAAIWQDVLKVERVGLVDNFFELGGHSLLATQMTSRIRQALGLAVPLNAVFEAATLGEFVQALASRPTQQRPPLKRLARGESLALSYAQERQWFLWQLDPSSAAYHIPMALRLRGPLDTASLQHSFDSLVSRHESLRTTLRSDAEHARQWINPPAPVRIEQVAVANEAELHTSLEAEVRRLFDLHNGPLLRVKLFRLGHDEHVLLLTLHHIVSDAWSMQVLAEELIELYAAAREQRSAVLAPLPVQYADYALWQRQWMQAGERERQLQYWLEQLGGEQAVLELPTDHPRPAVQSYRGARFDMQLPDSLAAGLKRLAQQANATPFMLLLASFQVLLYRYSGQAQIRVGVPIANRNLLETERLIGFFVNTQVLKAEFDPQLPFSVALQQVRRTALDAQDHQDLPFEQLVDALQPERSLSHTPLFQVMFNHRSHDLRQALGQRLDDLQIEELAWQGGTAQFDLTLDTYETAHGLNAALTYASDLFEPATIARMAGHWLNLLQAVLADPQQCLGDLPLLGAAEREQLVQRWQPLDSRWHDLQPVHQRIAGWAERTPQAIAVHCAGRQLSFAQLEAQANALAAELVARGIGAETLVGIALPRSVEMIVGLLAIHKAGAAYVPLDPQYPRERLAFLIEDAAIALLLSTSALAATLPVPAGLALLALDQLDLTAANVAAPQVAIDPRQLAYVIYTSGSTGQPKGVTVEHGPLAMHCQAIGARYEMSPADCELHFMSFAFDGAHERWLTALTHGARLLLRDDSLWSPEQTYEAMRAHGVSVAAFPPAYLQQLAEHAERDGHPPNVRVYCFGGDAVPHASFELAKRALRPQYIINGYGPTETVVTPLIWKAGRDDSCQAAYAPIGTRIGERSAQVLDSGLALLPVGLVGELYLGGSGVARGYLRRPSLTAERFVPDPFGAAGARLYRSGDLVRQRADGVVDYLGRIDHQVKVRGFRIELGEIEARLQDLPEVREALVLARESALGAQLVAYLTLTEHGPALDDRDGLMRSRAALKAALKQALPGYMVPSHLLFLECWPLTPNGKVDRKALPAPDLGALQQDYLAPETDLQRQIAAVWQQVLQLPQVGLGDNFFELGGHSLLATQATALLQRQLAGNIPLDLLFKAAALSDYALSVSGCVSTTLDEDLSDMYDFLAELEAN